MKFQIIKSVSHIGTFYRTRPKNFFLRVWHWNFLPEFGQEDIACRVFLSKKEALLHIKRWNSGYYKKKYYEVRV